MRSVTSTPTLQPYDESISSREAQERQPSMEANQDATRPIATKTATSQASIPGARQPGRSRRSRPVRDANHVARDSLVDQIMRESAVPIYDRSTSDTPLQRPDEEGEDRDAAAAEAFKQQHFARLEENKKRKPPAPQPGERAKLIPTSHGPKLGGSRSQREKMKAMESARKNKK